MLCQGCFKLDCHAIQMKTCLNLLKTQSTLIMVTLYMFIMRLFIYGIKRLENENNGIVVFA